jgi:ribosomal protein S21
MPIEVKKKEGESTASLMRRFTRRIQQSKILVKAKGGKFFKKPKSKRQIQQSALRRAIIRREKRKLVKMGLLEENQVIPKEKLKRILRDQ